MTQDSYWVRWHHGYHQPGSSLQRRLEAVRTRVVEVLDTRPAGPIRVLSRCAGQGQDLIGPLSTHPRREDVQALLVELDPHNAAVAREAARAAGLSGVTVAVEDAGAPAAYDRIAPVDLALVCGVFGNIGDDDIRATIGYLPALLRPGGHVIWTRHRAEPDLTPAIRDWFAQAGFSEVAYDCEPAFRYGVGTQVLNATHVLDAAPCTRPPRPQRLFTFTGNGCEAAL